MNQRHAPGASPIVWGLGSLALLALAVGALFGLRPPHLHAPFRVHALVHTDASMKKGTPIRIAGVEVGHVVSVEPGPRGSNAAMATMQIEPEGLPIHTDATAKVRPRLILEGNFFVDLSPGTPARPVLRSGESLGADAVTGPVQFDRFLTDLPKDTRTSLQGVLRGYGAALGSARTPGGRSGGQGLNDSLRDSPQALGGTAIVTRATLGTARNDFSKGIGGTGRLLAGLAQDDQQLADLVTNFDRTVSAFADRAPALRRTVVELDATSRVAGPALDALDGALPPLTTLARKLVPGVSRLNSTITATRPWLTQATGLLGQSELGGLSQDLQPIVADTADTIRASRGLTDRVDAVDRCFLDRLLPISRKSVVDPPLTTGIPLYTEGLQALAGLGGAAAGFDGNGSFLRSQAGGGSVPVKTSELAGQGPLFGNADVAPSGTRPASPGKLPPVRTGVSCDATPLPELKAATGVGPVKRKRAHLPVVILTPLLALVVGGYILLHQTAFSPPSWLPLVGKDRYVVNAAFTTSQAVVPGQGQRVTIAGVPIGLVGGVKLIDGQAVVRMDLEPKYGAVYRDAHIVLRPRTPLKDMYLALDPGTPKAGRIPEGGTLPVSQTLPDVDADEFLSSLDGDTRSYLQLLLQAAGTALGTDADGRPSTRQVNDLRTDLQRFAPLSRDTRRLTSALVSRRVALRGAVHNFGQVAGELGRVENLISSFVGSSNQALQVFAQNDTQLRSALTEFPAALRQTQQALRSSTGLSTQIASATRRLQPFATALEPSLTATDQLARETTDDLRDGIRPAVRTLRSPVAELRPGAAALSRNVAPAAETFRVVRNLVQALAYNPKGKGEEGYLFWASWLGHLGASVASLQDGNGPTVRALTLLTCPQLDAVAQIETGNETFGALLNFSNLPDRLKLCPNEGDLAAALGTGTTGTTGASGTAGATGTTGATR